MVDDTARTVAPIVSMRGLRKRFGVLEVLKGIDLDVQPGEVVAIIGRSGSGKSTLLRCINGLESHEGGTLEVEGRRLQPGHADAMRALRQRVGMIFQGFNLFPHLTVGRNILLAPGLVRASAAMRRKRGPANCWRGWGWPRNSTPGPTSCRAASSSGWRSPARWRWIRRCCCVTRSPPPSTWNWWERC